MVGPLLSRSLLLTLEPLTDEDIREVVEPGARPTSAGSAAASTLAADGRASTWSCWPAGTPAGR